VKKWKNEGVHKVKNKYNGKILENCDIVELLVTAKSVQQSEFWMKSVQKSVVEKDIENSKLKIEIICR
jgi:hypothetical protein